MKKKENLDSYIRQLAAEMAATTMKYVNQAYRRGIAVGFLLGLSVSFLIKLIGMLWD